MEKFRRIILRRFGKPHITHEWWRKNVHDRKKKNIFFRRRQVFFYRYSIGVWRKKKKITCTNRKTFLRDWNHFFFLAFFPLLFWIGRTLRSVFFATCALFDVAPSNSKTTNFPTHSFTGAHRHTHTQNRIQTNNRINKIYEFYHLNFFLPYCLQNRIESNRFGVMYDSIYFFSPFSFIPSSE